MLENYEINKDGIIHQLQSEVFNYQNYFDNRYLESDEQYNYMANLRLGFVLGVYGNIPSDICEIGYGKGHFLKACKEIIPIVQGYDIAPLNPPDGCQRIDGFKNRHIDIVCFFDSLEHIPDLYNFMGNIDSKMVIISLPWCHYNQIKKQFGEKRAEEWFEFWKHRKPNEHLWHFDPDSLEKFMNNFGYKAKIKSHNIEDKIRKTQNLQNHNILTAVYYKN